MASKEEVRRVSIYINGNEADLQLGQITRGSKKLYNELAKLTPGTDEFIQKAKELKEVNALLKDIKDDVTNVVSSFDELKESLVSAISVTGAIEGIQSIIAQNVELSDSLADIQKTTGLTSTSVIHLNEDLKKIDSRSAMEELQGLAMVAGKLGISAEKDVFAFVKAADQISVALGEDLGGAEEAINSLGKLTDIFKIKETYGLEGSLLKIGSAINELGAAGTANEGYLVNFAGRLAGIAPAANISIQNVLGLAAVMDELQQPAEASSTAIGQFVVGLGKDIPKFAAIAKMSVKDFSDLLNKDGNEALIKVLQNTKSTGEGIQGLAEKMGMVGEDGARAVTALGALSNNLDLLQKRQALSNWEFLKGTSLTSEFEVKNSNLAATLEKLSKKMNSVWTDSVILEALTAFARLVYDNVDAIGSMIKVLVIAAVAWGSYRTAIFFATVAKREYIKTLIASETIEKLSIISTTLLGLAKAVLTGNLRKAKQEMQLLNATMSSNPYALVIAGVVALGAALYLFGNRLTDAEKAQKVLNDIVAEGQKSIAGEKNKLISLIDVIKDETLAKSARIAKVNELRAIMPSYLKFYSDEEILAGKATNAIGEYIKQLERKAQVDAALKKLTSLDEDRINVEKQIVDGPKSEGYFDRVKRGLTTGDNTDASYIKDLKEKKKAIEAEQEMVRAQMNKTIVADVKAGTVDDKKDNTVAKKIEWLKNQINILEIAYGQLNEADKMGMAANVAQRRELKKQLDAFEGSTKDPKKNPGEDKKKKLFNAAEDERFSSLARTAQAIMDNYAKELSEADEHFRQLQHKHSTNAAAVAQIEMERVAKLKEIEKKFKKDDLETLTALQNEISQLATEAIKNDSEKQMSEVKLATNLKLQQLDKEDALVREKIQKQKNSIQSLKKDGKNDEAAILEASVTRELDILDASGKLREQFLKNQGVKEAKITKTAAENKKLSQLEANVINADSTNPNSKSAIAAHIELLTEKHRLEVENAEKIGVDVAAIDAKFNADKMVLQETGANATRDFLVKMAETATSSIFSIMANNRQAELSANLDGIEKQREDELSNKKLTEAQKKAINDKYDAQVKVEKTKAWKAEQRASISQALINGAIGVTAAWKNPFTAPFTIPLIIGTTLAQVAVIASQEVPKYEHGGFSAIDYDKVDSSSPSGFVRRPTLFNNSSSGRSFIAGEGNKTEYIISSEQLKDPVIADFVSAIEGIRGVKRFESGGYSNTTIVQPTSQPAIIQQAPQVIVNTEGLEKKMDDFISAAENAWNYRVFEEKQEKILDARKNASA